MPDPDLGTDTRIRVFAMTGIRVSVSKSVSGECKDSI
jgi:hypothetical protein